MQVSLRETNGPHCFGDSLWALLSGERLLALRSAALTVAIRAVCVTVLEGFR
jgi:hypothetical protein